MLGHGVLRVHIYVARSTVLSALSRIVRCFSIEKKLHSAYCYKALNDGSLNNHGGLLMDDTVWLVLMMLGAGGLALALCLMVKLKSDKLTRRRRWSRNIARRDRYVHDA